MNFFAQWLWRRTPAFDRTVAADTLGRAFAEHGVVLIRGALETGRAASLEDVVDRIYDVLESALADGAPMDDDLRSNFTRWRGVWLAGLPQVLAMRAPALNAEFTTAVAMIHGLVTRYFPENSWRPTTAVRSCAGARTRRRP